ncbi:MAG: ECF-type sigma factor [Acidobacteriota bacterium]|nr:ECF-type sigma factor [Acidobacteriota bacterium]
MEERSPKITQLLRAHERGEEGALSEAIGLIYGDLKRLAHRQLQSKPSREQLDTTALVHETYLRLAGHEGASWRDRHHFFAASATAMRHLIVDRVRERMAVKRGAGQRPITLDEEQPTLLRQSELALDVDAALEGLGRLDPRLVQVVECRFYAGFSAEETASVMDVSSRTVERYWQRARAWLRRDLDALRAADDR